MRTSGFGVRKLLVLTVGQKMNIKCVFGNVDAKARIQVGRSNLRHAIFMPALVAIQHNADLKAKYDQLVSAGKEKKVAITAIMRKLLILANALLRDQRKWTQKQH